MKSNYLLTELTSELLSSPIDWRCSNLVYNAEEHSLYSFDVLIACQQGVAGKWSWLDPNEKSLKTLTPRQIAYMMKQQVIVKQLVNEHNCRFTKKKQEEARDMFGGRTLDQVVADKLRQNRESQPVEVRRNQYTGSGVGMGSTYWAPITTKLADPIAPAADKILPGTLDKDAALLQSFKQFVAIIVREVMEENCYEN